MNQGYQKTWSAQRIQTISKHASRPLSQNMTVDCSYKKLRDSWPSENAETQKLLHTEGRKTTSTLTKCLRPCRHITKYESFHTRRPLAKVRLPDSTNTESQKSGTCTEREAQHGSNISSRVTFQGDRVLKPLFKVSRVIDKGDIVALDGSGSLKLTSQCAGVVSVRKPSQVVKDASRCMRKM